MAIPARVLMIFGAATVVSWAAAFGVTRVAGPQIAPSGALSPLDVQAPAASSGGGTTPTPSLTQTRRGPSQRLLVDPIVKRSIFDSSKVGEEAVSAEATGDTTPTDLNLVLVSTLVVEPAEYSSAWIGKPGSRSSSSSTRKRGKRGKRRAASGGGQSSSVSDAYGYGIGDTIVGEDATIVAIEQGLVTLQRSNGQLETLSMQDEKAASKKGEGSSSDEESDDGVEKVGQDHFTISRDVIDKLASDPSQLAKLGRAVPHKGPDGEVDGYRLSGIRRKSVGRQLGLRSGDIVHSINGFEMTSAASAMNAWNSLQDASSLEVDITRRGTKKGIRVDVE